MNIVIRIAGVIKRRSFFEQRRSGLSQWIKMDCVAHRWKKLKKPSGSLNGAKHGSQRWLKVVQIGVFPVSVHGAFRSRCLFTV